VALSDELAVVATLVVPHVDIAVFVFIKLLPFVVFTPSSVASQRCLVYVLWPLSTSVGERRVTNNSTLAASITWSKVQEFW
jgi:hypothetical protein